MSLQISTRMPGATPPARQRFPPVAARLVAATRLPVLRSLVTDLAGLTDDLRS